MESSCDSMRIIPDMTPTLQVLIVYFVVVTAVRIAATHCYDSMT